MRACSYVCEYHALQVVAGNLVVVEENINAVVCKVLKNGERRWKIGTAMTEENRLFDLLHVLGFCAGISCTNRTISETAFLNWLPVNLSTSDDDQDS